MNKIDKSEVLKIAHIAKIAVTDHELEAIALQMQDVLSYAVRVTQIATELDELVSQKNINTVRPDTVVPSHPQEILQRAPSHEENYIVVPKIL